MIVGERLKAVRESKQMTQGDIQRKTGLMRSYVSRCESGHTVPSIETLEKWSRAIGITLSELFAEGGEAASVLPALKDHQNDAPRLNRLATAHLRKVEKAFARMNPQDIAIVSAMAVKFAARGRLPLAKGNLA